MFQSQGTNNFSDIQKLVEQNGWNIYRVQNNSRKFVIRNESEARVFNWVTPIQSLYDTISANPITEFIKNYTAAMSGDGKVEIMKKEKKAKKIGAKSKLALELNERLTDITVKLMNMNLKRGSEEHTELRAQLRAVREQMKELGIQRQFGTGEMTAEELREARRYGEMKKKERKEKRGERVSKKNIQLSAEG